VSHETYLTERGEGPAGEEDNPLHLLVVEEIVEAPQRAVLSKGVGSEVRVVGVDVAIRQVYLLKRSFFLSILCKVRSPKYRSNLKYSAFTAWK
jgi:hypothetical protein